MANSSINLTQLDFETYKNSLKTFLKSQNQFASYDFEGSNMSVMLDLLSYNTYNNGFFLNMVGSEMWLDSAQLRDSVVSHAKELNYIPRSFRSAIADINISIQSSTVSKTLLTIPKGTSFTSKVGSNNYTFATDKNIVLNQDSTVSNSTVAFFNANNVSVFEGVYVSDTFNVDYSQTQRFIMSNPTIDTNSITVTIVEDTGSTTYNYIQASSLFGIDSTSKIYFLQATNNNQYEILFGDGVKGRLPKNNSVVVVQYRICNGQLPNGAGVFKSDGPINSETNITISTNTVASGGDVAEDINSIKLYAPRHFTTQERAVTASDFETLLKIQFPEIVSISAFGGEELNPPQYGKVYISLALSGFDGIPDSKKSSYTAYLKDVTLINVDPIFIDADILYVQVTSLITYNANLTTLSDFDIKTLVISSIMNYDSTYIDDFKSTLRYSRLIEAIDDAHDTIISNETDLRIMKKLNPVLLASQNIIVNYNTSLYDGINQIALNYGLDEDLSIFSGDFIYKGQTVQIHDDNNGNMRLVQKLAPGFNTIMNIGTVDYNTGTINLYNFFLDSYYGDSLRLYAKPKSKDLSSEQNVILRIPSDEIKITVAIL